MPVPAFESVRRFYSSEVRLSLKIIATSLVVGVVSALPLLLYAVLAPYESDAGALGLLAVSGVLLSQVGLCAGLLRLSWELLRD